MRTAIKVAALVAAVCAVAAIALAGGAVASGGHAGDGFGIMNGHGGTDALNGHGMGHRNGECTSNDCHEHRGTCEMAADRTAACATRTASLRQRGTGTTSEDATERSASLFFH